MDLCIVHYIDKIIKMEGAAERIGINDDSEDHNNGKACQVQVSFLFRQILHTLVQLWLILIGDASFG